ncbi:glycosyltransferase N-terminal domain-containing protein [Swaminathania salitolerans]|uniref:3-deoxy-D-manno-octulosonic acid transferase n=1 Tax=Swaminathania salitolerans TaxID=182838 RepID=A0A511BMS3_9PROT|nr:glycosyltransferase N-terminal domain-containing protein [Swaminathania salitolerans]GBQ16182.1 3-deoxy-D-manno-octulosonic-acid transferase [Swaminathania salitolerans LMG 21291]GEL01626.1 hypothetical protein SSA02_07890 [Swaminathania salitolerans]
MTLRTALRSLARAYLGLALHTTRWTISGAATSVPILTQTGDRAGQGAIVAAWHRSLLLLPALCSWARNKNPTLVIKVMISRNRDGRFISDLVAPWGIEGIEGSSDRKGKNKGGSRAFRRACLELQRGSVFAITPDGPRGPAEIAQPGTEGLLRLTGKPLVPLGAWTTALRLPSWDGLSLPLPWGRGVILYGPPVPEGSTSETITSRLNALSARARHWHRLGRATLPDRIWEGLGLALVPALRLMSLHRLRRGKEIRSRLGERRGRATIRRPPGELVWIHAASVGETRSVLPLIEAMSLRHPARHILVTSATTGGAEILARFISARDQDESPDASGTRATRGTVMHQFIPYDVAYWTRRFLDHWSPGMLLLTDSELWPGMLRQCARRAIPVAVLNARLSERSWRRWKHLSFLAGPLFERLALVAARGSDDAHRFRALGVRDVETHGDLKQNAPPPGCDAVELERLRACIGHRPVFLAASTHPGEDEIVLEAASQARRVIPDLLAILVPRHPVRGAAIARLARPEPPRRSERADPAATDPVWIADTLGELGLFYRLAQCAFIGNSLLPPGGGHNPFEAVRLDTAIATGPWHDNFGPAFAQLRDHVTTIHDADELAGWIVESVKNPEMRKEQARMARAAIQSDEMPPETLLARLDALSCA